MNNSKWQDRRVWLGGGLLAAVLVVAASYFMLTGPALDSARDLHRQEADAQTQNVLTLTKNSKLAAQNRQIAAKKAQLLAALDGLPPTTALPAFTLQATSLASADKVTLTGVTFGQPTAANSAANNGGTTESSASPAPSGTPPASTATTVAVTLSTTGSLANQTAFLSDLQKGLRRVLINTTQLSTANGAKGSSAATMTTQLTIFSAPMTKAQLATINRDLAAK